MILFQSYKINFHLVWVYRGATMTDPVDRIDGTQGAHSGGKYSGGSFSEGHKKRERPVPQQDLVEISQDARDRLGGKKKKGILDFLKELLE